MKLAHDVEFSQEIKKSRFICLLRRVENEEEFKTFLKEVKKNFPNATHYCTALKIGSTMRSSDDGEPSGTAGRPMLDVLAGSEADCIGAVVVRYFGGTLLGKGGLVRAYGSSVKGALEEAEFLSLTPMHYYQLRYGYEWIGKVDGFLRSHKIEKTEEEFTDEVISYVLSSDPIEEDLKALTAGNIQINRLKDIIVEQSCNSHIY